MTYQAFVRKLQEKRFTRIERDDRILDIFPKETREKGVEMWERNVGNDVQIMRVRLPYQIKTLKLFSIPASELETWLNANDVRALEDTYSIAVGESITEHI